MASTGVRQYDTAKRNQGSIKLPKKFSTSFERDWDYYMTSTDKEVRHPLQMCYFQYDKDGLDPKTCFFLYDTYGKQVLRMFKCSDPITCQRVIWGKQLLNMTIDMWCDDINGDNRPGFVLLHRSELNNELKSMPEWVKKAVDKRTS